jgi:FtsH-binding integral membrane protein
MNENKQKFHSKSQLKKFRKHFLLGGFILVVVILVLSFISSPKEEPVAEKITVICFSFGSCCTTF